MTIETFDYEVFPALIGWKDSNNTFNGIVLGTEASSTMKDSVKLLKHTIQKTQHDWKEMELVVVPMPGQSYERILVHVNDVVTLIESGRYPEGDCFSMQAGDLFF